MNAHTSMSLMKYIVLALDILRCESIQNKFRFDYRRKKCLENGKETASIFDQIKFEIKSVNNIESHVNEKRRIVFLENGTNQQR